MSSTSRTILIGSLIGAALGGAIAWAYHELSEQEDEQVPSSSELRFEATAGDLVKLGFAVIPLVRMITNFFVPAEEISVPLPDTEPN